MKVLVTGATGFTGGHMARWLKAHGDTVRVVVRDPARARDLAAAGIEVVKGDLTDSPSLREAARGCEVIYNIAALYRTAGLPTDAYRAVNAVGVASVVDAAGDAGVRRVVQCSTVGVHGHIEGAPANEDAPLQPGDVYQDTKLEGEQLGAATAARRGVEFVIARPSGIYGPGDRRLFKLFGKVARRRFVLLGDGHIYYHLTYVDDVAEGLRLCGNTPGAAGGTYIIAGAEIPTLREVIDLTAEIAHVPPTRFHWPVWPVWLAGAAFEALFWPLSIPPFDRLRIRLEPPLYRRRVDFFTKSRAFDTTRARTELGFAPRVTLRDGITRTLEWYREQRWI
jgi:nucleoside-diphosphate-sugar epimerase